MGRIDQPPRPKCVGEHPDADAALGRTDEGLFDLQSVPVWEPNVKAGVDVSLRSIDVRDHPVDRVITVACKGRAVPACWAKPIHRASECEWRVMRTGGERPQSCFVTCRAGKLGLDRSTKCPAPGAEPRFAE